MADAGEISEELLHQIRRAALELRHEHPQEAVRVLRRAAASGGAAEVLARGALGEIYFEEFADLDGAEHEYRKVLQLAPGLAAAELGLARVRREMGRLEEADAGLERALQALQRDVASFRDAGQPPPGAEEVVLTLLEVAQELGQLRDQRAQGAVQAQGGAQAAGAVPLDESLLSWSQQARLFDAIADEDPEAASDDWVRFHALRARLMARAGRAAEAASALAAAEEQGQLPHPHAERLRAEALEDAGDLAGAAAQLRRLLDADKAAARPWQMDDVLRGAALLAASGDETSAASYLTAALTQLQGQLQGAQGEERVALEADRKRVQDALAEPAPEGQAPGLVRLGRGRQR